MDPDSRKTVEARMEKSIEHLIRDLGKMRTGRASTSLLDGVMVDYYGTPTPLNQIATLNTPEAKLITVQPWDISVIEDIEKAISKADLGLNPSNDGKVIRLPIPPLNEERRRELVKRVRQIGEDAKVAIRQVRRDANDQLKKEEKDKQISETELKQDVAEVQKMTDSSIQKIEKILQSKEEELMQV